MNKQFYIESMHNNLHILFAMGVIQDEMYLKSATYRV